MSDIDKKAQDIVDLIHGASGPYLETETSFFGRKRVDPSMKVFFDRKIRFPRLFALLGRVPFLRGLRPLLVVPLTEEMTEWIFGIFAKIVCSVETETDLLLAYKLAQDAGLPCALIQDMGATEFHGVPTYTTVALGRAELIDPITAKDTGTVKTTLA